MLEHERMCRRSGQWQGRWGVGTAEDMAVVVVQAKLKANRNILNPVKELGEHIFDRGSVKDAGKYLCFNEALIKEALINFTVTTSLAFQLRFEICNFF